MMGGAVLSVLLAVGIGVCVFLVAWWLVGVVTYAARGRALKVGRRFLTSGLNAQHFNV